MDSDANLEKIKAYFEQKLESHGATPQGVDWNSPASQELRFDQLAKLFDSSPEFSLLDYGCGYGALGRYLAAKGYSYRYWGYDISEAMIAQARTLFQDDPNFKFTAKEAELQPADYAVASGIFNLKLSAGEESWKAFVLQTLQKLNALGERGFAFNMLTRYSDADHMRADLYYPDPCFYFDYCKTHFSRNVALLHDYDLYDFTVIVRKLHR